MSEPVFIIAEAGVNHNGDMDLAGQLIDVAADAGADAVKFQTFRADQVVSRQAPKAEYQVLATGQAETQFEMIRRLELSEDDHETLISHARSRGISFLSTPFDISSLHMLTTRFGLQTIKIPSGDTTNFPFLLAIARVLGHLPAALRPAAYGAAPPPSDRRIEAIARRARLRRPWRR